MNAAEELDARIKAMAVPAYDARLSNIMDEAKYHEYAFRNPGHTYYVYLAKLVKALQPRKVVELGTDIGRSGLFIMTQLPEKSEFWTVEIGDHPAVDLDPFKGDPRLHILKGSDLDPRNTNQIGGGIDLLFVDTNHEYTQAMTEWAVYKMQMNRPGVAVFDDISLNPGMQQFWNEVTETRASCGTDIHNSGFGLVTL